jgi:hypothetical protein
MAPNPRSPRRGPVAAHGNKRDGASQFDVTISYREMLVKGLGEEALAEEIVHKTPQNERSRAWNNFLSPECGFSSELMRGWKIGSVFVQRGGCRALMD